MAWLTACLLAYCEAVRSLTARHRMTLRGFRLWRKKYKVVDVESCTTHVRSSPHLYASNIKTKHVMHVCIMHVKTSSSLFTPLPAC